MPRGRARRPPARRSRGPQPMVGRALLLAITVAMTALIAIATVLDMIDNGVSWLDIVALLVVLLFATGICGALWESLRRPR
jgi:hypothetical protein